MNKTTSEKIMMMFNKLANDAKKAGKPEDKDKRPESRPEPPMGMPPMGPAGMPPIGPPPEIRTLVLLKAAGKEMKRPEIGMILGLSPKANDKSIDKLAENGFVSVRQDSPNDSKKTLVSITEAGLEKLEQDKEEKRKRADSFCENLTEEEKETLLTLLQKLKK